MKTKLTKLNWQRAFKRAGNFISMATLGAAILICSSASAQNLFVSGRDANGGEIFKFTWDGRQSIYVSGLYQPSALAFDGTGNLFVVDYMIVGDLHGYAAIYKITPAGGISILASGLSYASSLAIDKMGNVFVADYDNGIIYQYKPSGSRATFASGLNHPKGMAFDGSGNLFVADGSIGNLYQGSIYEYTPNGSRVTFADLNPGDRPAGLAFDNAGNLFVADLGGNIYKYVTNGVLRRYSRTTFGVVPTSAQSLAFDSSGDLFVVDTGGVNASGTTSPNAIYKFTSLGTRSTFESGIALSESFACIAAQPIACCQ